MKLLEQQLEDTKYSYTVSLDLDDLNKVRAKTLRSLSSNLKIPGFRSNKAPLEIIERYLSSQKLNEQFLNDAINEYYSKSLEDTNYLIVSEPSIEVQKYVYNRVLDFKVSLEVIAKIKLKDYQNIKIDIKKPVVSEKDLESTLKELKNRLTKYEKVGREIKKGDQVTINFNGYDAIDNKALKEASSNNYNLIIGSNSFIAGFESELIAHKKNDHVIFELKFPDNYSSPEFRSRNVRFEVDILEVKKAIPQELDDQNVKQFGPFTTVDVFKDEIKKQIQSEKELAFKKELDSRILEEIAGLVQNNIPESMLQKEVNLIEEEEKKYALYNGQTWDEYLNGQKLTLDSYRKKINQFAIKRIKSGLGISELVKKLNIEVESNEIESRLNELQKRYSTDPEIVSQLSSPNIKSEIELQITTEKVLDQVKAKILN